MTDRKALHDPNEPPEDVASLYSWANLHGAKYRDFSASRAQNRERVRLQMQQADDAERLRVHLDAELQQAEAARRGAEMALAAERARQAEFEAHQAAQQAAFEAAQEAAHQAAQQAVRQAAQQAAQLAAQQAAQEARAAQHAAQLAARQAAEQAAQEAAQRAAQLEAQERARRAAEQAAQEARAAQVAAQEAARQAAEQAAQERARQAAEQAARERAAQQAAQEAAEQAAQEAAQERARRAAELAAQEAARQAAEQAALERARQAAEQAARERAAQQAAQEAAERAAREAAQERARQAAEQAARERAAQEAAERAAQEAAQERVRRAAEQAARERAAQQAAQQAAQEMARQAAEQAAQQARAAQVQAAHHAEAARAAQQAAQQAAWQQPVPERNAPPAQPPRPTYSGAAFPLPGGHAQPAQPAAAREDAAAPAARTPWSGPEGREIPTRPAWLAERPTLSGVPIVSQTPEDTIQGSRERLTSRWFALKGVFDTASVAAADAAPAPAPRAPVMAVFSLAGGVGKTSMVATLGRALSSRGERVLLVDTAAFGLLPFFFGARDQRPGQLRTFSPPPASGDAPIQMIAVDPETLGPEEGGQEPLTAEIQQYIRGVGRVIVDLATASGSTTRRILRLSPLVLVPVIPDMNSVVSVGSIDAFFERNSSLAGKATLPHYVLNQFDASLPLHLDVREVLREQLGDRLLPFALRRAPAVSEALAEGMTVMDYAPNSTVAEDFGSLAGWVKSQSAPASSGFRGVRWSER